MCKNIWTSKRWTYGVAPAVRGHAAHVVPRCRVEIAVRENVAGHHAERSGIISACQKVRIYAKRLDIGSRRLEMKRAACD